MAQVRDEGCSGGVGVGWVGWVSLEKSHAVLARMGMGVCVCVCVGGGGGGVNEESSAVLAGRRGRGGGLLPRCDAKLSFLSLEYLCTARDRSTRAGMQVSPERATPRRRRLPFSVSRSVRGVARRPLFSDRGGTVEKRSWPNHLSCAACAQCELAS